MSILPLLFQPSHQQPALLWLRAARKECSNAPEKKMKTGGLGGGGGPSHDNNSVKCHALLSSPPLLPLNHHHQQQRSFLSTNEETSTFRGKKKNEKTPHHFLLFLLLFSLSMLSGRARAARRGPAAAAVGLVLAAAIAYPFLLMHLHEQVYFFSALSTEERRITFKSEQAFYFSYFDRAVEVLSRTDKPTTLWDVVEEFVWDTHVEHPFVANALQKFNVFAEVFLAALYHLFANVVFPESSFFKPTCFKYNRQHLPAFVTCTGWKVKEYFYINSAFVLQALSIMSISFVVWKLSDGSLSSLALFLSYYALHLSDATRVMWAVPLRETFGIPFLFALLALLVAHLSRATSDRRVQATRGRAKQQMPHSQRSSSSLSAAAKMIVVGVVAAIFPIAWQFAAFVLVLIVAAAFSLYAIGAIREPAMKSLFVVLALSWGFVIAVHFGNSFLVSSLYSASLVGCGVALYARSLLGREPESPTFRWQSLLLFGVTTMLTKGLFGLAGFENDGHVFDLLRAHFFEGSATFHTRLYTCSKAFSPMSQEYRDLSASGLLPAGAFVGIVVLLNLLWLFIWSMGLLPHRPSHEDRQEALQDKEKNLNNADNVGDTRRRRSTTLARLRKKKNAQQGNVRSVAASASSDLDIREIPCEDVKALLVENAPLYFFIALATSFFMLAAFMMRLKALFVPLHCATSSLICSQKFLRILLVGQQRPSKPVMTALSRSLACIAVILVFWAQGAAFLSSIKKEGEFNDPATVALVNALQKNTPANSSLSSTMSVTSTLLATVHSAAHPISITNHPHYEHRAMRDTTYNLYQVYGYTSDAVMHQILRNDYKVDFLIVDAFWCGTKRPTGCNMHELYELGSRAETGYQRTAPDLFCAVWGVQHLDSGRQAGNRFFKRVYSSKRYQVLEVKKEGSQS